MARGRKSYTLEEQYERVTDEIERMEASLKELKNTKKTLEERIRNSELSKLNDLISESGLSFEEVKGLLVNRG